ncbi:MAG: hypothetical protein M1819_004503 [Sarea resinae]|nr:MAG: hypothetical protein M1819_004503 [Sarea resinae]
MGLKDHVPASSGLLGFIFRATLRFLQFVLAIAVAGLYGQDLNDPKDIGKGAHPKWVYAEVVSGLSALTCAIYTIPLVRAYIFFAWDTILFILWLALFGIFGKIYIHEHSDGDGGVQRMKNAVWVVLVNMLLWALSATYGAAIFSKSRRVKSIDVGHSVV